MFCLLYKCVYLGGDDASLISFHEFQSNWQDISNFINDEPCYDICIIDDFNADPFGGRFVYIFESQFLDHSLSLCDVIQLPASYFKYISRNSSARTS